MEHGYLVLSVVALFFISIYTYAYASVAIENKKEEKAKNDLITLKEEMRALKVSNQIKRDEKLAQLFKRSEEIRQELRELQLKKDLRNQNVIEKFEIARMKTQMDQKQVG